MPKKAHHTLLTCITVGRIFSSKTNKNKKTKRNLKTKQKQKVINEGVQR